MEVSGGSRDKTSDSFRLAANNFFLIFIFTLFYFTLPSAPTLFPIALPLKSNYFFSWTWWKREMGKNGSLLNMTNSQTQMGKWGDLGLTGCSQAFKPPRTIVPMSALNFLSILFFFFSPCLLQKNIFWLIRKIENQHKLCTFLKLIYLLCTLINQFYKWAFKNWNHFW